MQVKKIHFIESVPGQPIYEMENGTIRLPFPDGRTSSMLWLSEEDVLKSLTQPTAENKNIIIAQFNEAKRLINKNAPKRKIIDLSPGNTVN